MIHIEPPRIPDFGLTLEKLEEVAALRCALLEDRAVFRRLAYEAEQSEEPERAAFFRGYVARATRALGEEI